MHQNQENQIEVQVTTTEKHLSGKKSELCVGVRNDGGRCGSRYVWEYVALNGINVTSAGHTHTHYSDDKPKLSSHVLHDACVNHTISTVEASNEHVEGKPIKTHKPEHKPEHIQCAHNFGIPEYYHCPRVSFIWNTSSTIWLRKVTAT